MKNQRRKGSEIYKSLNNPPRIYSCWQDVPKIPELYVRPGRPKPSIAFLHKSAVKLIPEFAAFDPSTDMEFRSLCSQKFAQAFYESNK